MDDFEKMFGDMIDFMVVDNIDLNQAMRTIQAAVDVVLCRYAIKHGWEKWGDGEWREATACSLCGSGVPGICAHAKNPNQVVLRGMAAVEAQHAAESR